MGQAFGSFSAKPLRLSGLIMVPDFGSHQGWFGQGYVPSFARCLGYWDVTNGFIMRALFSSDWFLPMLGGFAIGGLFVFGTNPVFAALF